MDAYSEVLRAKTSRKQQALDYISEYILEHGRSPAMSEIALALGVSDGWPSSRLVFRCGRNRLPVSVGRERRVFRDRLRKLRRHCSGRRSIRARRGAD